MSNWLKDVDRILRGDATRVSKMRDGEVPISAFGTAVMVILLGMIYGFFMGWFAVINREKPEYWQVLASTLKVPALFWLTLIVTFPSLYVFNVLVGSRLRVGAVFKLLLASLAVTLAVLASFGTITAFFSVTSRSYEFMKLLNVALFAVAGVLGLVFLLRTLHRITIAEGFQQLREPPSAPSNTPSDSADPDSESLDDVEATDSSDAGPLEPLEGHVLGANLKTVFYCWVLIFALVGAQMSWVLRPFIGDPGMPFEWFRQRESNFFEAVGNTIAALSS